MLSRRSFLSATPIAVMAAPQIAQALPAPMPVVDAGRFGPTPWRGDPVENPKTLARIWAHWGRRKHAITGQIRASEMKAMMEDTVEAVTGHRPPFLLHTPGEDFYDFIFHKVADRIDGGHWDEPRLIGPILDQPCYVLEWTKERWATIASPNLPPRTDLVEPMAFLCFREENRVIYDL